MRLSLASCECPRASDNPRFKYLAKGDAMKRDFDVVVERDSAGNYVASVPLLPGCHTQARSLDALMDRIREAIELCLEVQDLDTEPLDFVGVQRVTVSR